VQPYSPERRTALVLCGTGAHGAYQAGVLRALREAGVKIDVMAGHGIGAGSAALAAIDGAARLWDPDGIWRSPLVSRLYQWKWPLRVAAWLVPLLGVACLIPPLIVAEGTLRFVTWLPILAFGALASAFLAGAAIEQWRRPARRRTDGAWWWRVFGAPLDGTVARDAFLEAISDLVPGRRYAEALADSLGQPGFRELIIVATDLDSRRDMVAALLREPQRREFLAPRPEGERRSEVLDLGGAGGDHAIDIVAAALTPPVVCDPHRLTFPADSYWRGETHRLCDRPGAVSRLLEELAAAGVSQAIVVSGVAAPSEPHRLRASRLDLRHRLGEFLAAAESAALRDALEMARLRFDSVHVICPAHNPVGAFDVTGAYDEASDRRQDVPELMDRGYDDAYRRFIEPVVGASGERLARASSRAGPRIETDLQ
jgi:methylmalonyl-CoA mutase cobalamin-binding subunit